MEFEGDGERAQEFWGRVKKCQLPRPPDVALRLLELTHTGSNLKEPAQLISREPTLAAEILTIVNSPWFGLKREVSSITQAVVLLGADSVCSLASAFSLRNSLNSLNEKGFDYSSYWRRSLLAATAARVLASQAGLENREEVFLAALLQDIGMLVLSSAFPEVYPELLEEAQGDHRYLQEIEHRSLGTDHVHMGVYLQETWGLPEIFRWAVKGSHDPSQVQVDERSLRVLKCITLSGPLAEIWEAPDTREACFRACRAVRLIAHLESEQLHSILVSIAKDYRKASEMFKVSGEGPDRIHQVLAKAMEELERLSIN